MDTATHRRLMVSYGAFVGSNAGLSWLSATMGRDGLAGPQVAGLLLLHAAASTAASVVWSDVADRQRRRVGVLRWVAAASCLLASGLLGAHAPAAWAVVLVVFGLVRGGVGPLLDASTLDLLADRRDYARLRLWGSGSFLVLVLAAGQAQAFHDRGALALGQAALAIGAVAVLGLPEAPWGARRTAAWRELVWDPHLGPLAAVAFLHGVTLTTYDHLFTLLADARGLAPWDTGLALTAGVVTEIAVMASAPWLLRQGDARRLLAVAVATGVPRWWLTAVVHDPYALAAVQVLHGLGFGGFWIAAVELFGRHAPEGRATSAQALLVVATYGVGRMASMGLAALSLQVVTIDAHFAAMSVVSLAAFLALVGRR